jgi:dipeptidyl aminopeptidase/acylaminoacyl peptidase
MIDLSSKQSSATSNPSVALTSPREVSFRSLLDDSEQLYVELLPEAFDEKAEHHLLIALHGHGADRWQYATDPRDECRAARDVAALYNMIYVSPDYRATTSWMGSAAEVDLLQIIQELRAKYEIGKVVLVGGSMGGSSALTFTALHPHLIAGVCSQNPMVNHLEFAGFQEAISESFGGSKRDIPKEYKRRSAEYWPERLTMPVGVTTGGKDDIVPPDSALRLVHVLTEMGRPVFLIHREETAHETDYADTAACLEFVLKASLGG